MINEKINQEIADLVSHNEEALKALVSSPDAPAVQKALKDYGIEITLEEVQSLYEEGARGILNAQDQELSAEDLDDVSGGGFWAGTLSLALSCAAGFGYGCFCGVCPAAYAYAPRVAVGLAAVTVAAYKKKGW